MEILLLVDCYPLCWTAHPLLGIGGVSIGATSLEESSSYALKCPPLPTSSIPQDVKVKSSIGAKACSEAEVSLVRGDLMKTLPSCLHCHQS